ncbi:MAG: 50S ribosomal protein L25/general stress protein Ctc [Bosea sp.]|jgi:large subunit ribosomal protein L25|nr:50S ribosomal protein L25/general stress protein Ctc [Bosea sp. (in: a-proteobacteria)]
MSEVKHIKASARTSGGKGAARAVRRTGQVPAVIYGGGEAALPIALDYAQTHRMIYAGHFLTTAVEIEVDGQTIRAIPRDYQLDPVKDTPLHVDFMRLSAGSEIRVVVPIHISGQELSPGVKRGGLVQLVEHTIELMAPADNIPEAIDISVASMNIGASVHLKDVVLPPGCRAISRENLTLVAVSTPTKMVEEMTSAAPAAEAAPAKAAKN